LQCEIRRSPAIEDHPLVLTHAVGSQKLILDYSPEIKGLQRDMPLQQALSLHKDVQIVPADVPHYWAIFNKILDSLEEKSPIVEGSDLGYAYMGLDGLQLIYQHDSILVDAIREIIPEAFAAQIGVADGKFLAYLAALCSPPGGYKIVTGNIDVFLKDISCDVLPISIKSKQKLHYFGIDTLGKVAAMQPGPLQAQFGLKGKRIWELAKGCDDTPLCPRFTEEIIEESATLPSATVFLEAILVTVESLLSRVFSGDALKGRGIRSITLWTQSWNSEHWEQSIHFKEPAMDIKNAISRIKHVMENSPQLGPVEQLGIRITGLSYQQGRQKSLFPEVRAKEHLQDDIKQLEIKMGSPQVFKIKEVEPWSRIPERRFGLTPSSQ
jgi:DNA polymerase-4/protein ImuB